MEFGVDARIGVQFMAMHHIHFATLIESDRDFQHEEQVITRSADARHDLRDPVRIGKGFVDRVAQLFDQAFEIIVQLQGSPGRSRLTAKMILGLRREDVKVKTHRCQ